jgi:starch-binding outer membrane protein, SusD/RagB family
MKRIQKNTRLILAGSLGMLVLLYACGKNFLNKPPIGPLSASALANKAGVDGLLIGAYSLLDGTGGNGGGWAGSSDNWVYGGVAADDAYKGSTASDQGDIQALEIWTATSTNSYPDGKFAIIYDGINRSNAVLKNMRLVSSLSAADTTEFAAEARFLRGYYHFEGVRMWGKVPYIDEAANNSNVLTYTNKNDITPNIIDDFTFAMNNLPATQSQDGRANKYAAEALLAKVYMYQLNYTAALPLLNDLINNGVTAKGDKYTLVPFTYNFNPATKNSAECIFAVQMSVNDGSAATGTPNGNYGDALNFPYGGGPGACCGFNNPSQSLVNAFKTDANGLPLLDGSYNTLGKDIRQAHGTAYTGTLDPRVDWTAGREGVPYLDWGLHPGDAWIRDAGQDGHFNPKKTVYAKAQQGALSDGTGTYWASTEITANNYAVVRFADVLLWAAEALIGSGGDANQAEAYVNQVRTRAADKSYWVYTDGAFDASTYFYKGGTVPADNYKVSPYPAGAFSDPVYALKAIQMERRLELAEEGHRFFDLQRWDKASPGFMANTLNAYAAYEASIGRSEYGPPVVTFTKGKNEVFAIPQSQIDAEGLPGGGSALTQNPGY